MSEVAGSTADGRVRAIIVGCGVIGRHHVSVMGKNDDIDLVALVDLELSAADRLAETVASDGSPHRPRTYASLEEALRAESVDLVAVCTPSGTHADVAVQAIEAGKHVVIEKPLDVDLASARRVAAAAEGRDQVVSVISQHRFDDASMIVTQALEQGRLGRVTSGLASVGWWRSQGYYDSGDWRGTWELDGGGAVMNQGVHSVDLLVSFLGRPVEVYARSALLAHARIQVEDTAVATVTFESGALGLVHATTAAFPGLTARLHVLGDRGSAVIDNDELSYFHALDEGDDEGGASYGLLGSGNRAEAELERYRAQGPAADPLGGHHRQYRDVLAAIAERRPPVVGVSEGTVALATVCALYVSASLGKAVLVDDVLAGRYDDTIAGWSSAERSVATAAD